MPTVPDSAEILLIEQAIYAGDLDVCRVNNGILIGKLPGGPLQYLHKLFAPADTTLTEVKNILGFPIPSSYAQFFSLSDGAVLFDNTLFVYGIRGATTREISVDNIRPVSLREQVDLKRKINPDLKWVEVGSLAASTKNYLIEIDSQGVTALCSPDGQRREYPRFLSLLLTLVQILQSNSGPQGLIDASAQTLQTEIDSLIHASRQ